MPSSVLSWSQPRWRRLSVALALAGCACGVDLDNSHLQYRGGRLLAHPRVRNVYLGDFYSTLAGQADARYNDAFMAALVVDPGYTSVWHQYGVGPGAVEPSVFIGGAQAGLSREWLERLTATLASDDERWHPELIYNFVLSPGDILEMKPGLTSLGGLGGLHSSVHLSDGRVALLTAVVYSDGANGYPLNGVPRDAVTVLESHEVTEAATDPDLADAVTTPGLYGWVNDRGDEVADVTMNSAPPGTSRAEMFDRMPGGYAVQKLWSIVDQASEISAQMR